MPRDISEAALEILVVADMAAAEWLPGEPNDFDRACSVDLMQLRASLQATQPKAAAALDVGNDGPMRRALLSRLINELNKRGVVDREVSNLRFRSRPAWGRHYRLFGVTQEFTQSFDGLHVNTGA